MVDSKDILKVFRNLLDKGIPNCPNIASQMPLTIAIPAKEFNDACEICCLAEKGIASVNESDIGEGDEDTEHPDPADTREENFRKFKTPKEALQYYYAHHLNGRHTECFEFWKELKILEWLYSKKGL